MTKTITRQQIAGSQGEAFVRERAHDMGFLFNPYGQVRTLRVKLKHLADQEQAFSWSAELCKEWMAEAPEEADNFW
jgi:hypothetical protein